MFRRTYFKDGPDTAFWLINTADPPWTLVGFWPDRGNFPDPEAFRGLTFGPFHELRQYIYDNWRKHAPRTVENRTFNIGLIDSEAGHQLPYLGGRTHYQVQQDGRGLAARVFTTKDGIAQGDDMYIKQGIWRHRPPPRRLTSVKELDDALNPKL